MRASAVASLFIERDYNGHAFRVRCVTHHNLEILDGAELENGLANGTISVNSIHIMWCTDAIADALENFFKKYNASVLDKLVSIKLSIPNVTYTMKPLEKIISTLNFYCAAKNVEAFHFAIKTSDTNIQVAFDMLQTLVFVSTIEELSVSLCNFYKPESVSFQKCKNLKKISTWYCDKLTRELILANSRTLKQILVVSALEEDCPAILDAVCQVEPGTLTMLDFSHSSAWSEKEARALERIFESQKSSLRCVILQEQNANNAHPGRFPSAKGLNLVGSLCVPYAPCEWKEKLFPLLSTTILLKHLYLVTVSKDELQCIVSYLRENCGSITRFSSANLNYSPEQGKQLDILQNITLQNKKRISYVKHQCMYILACLNRKSYLNTDIRIRDVWMIITQCLWNTSSQIH